MVGFGIIVDVIYIDLRYQYLIIGTGDDASRKESVQHRFTGGTVPLPVVYKQANIWIFLDARTKVDYFLYGGFELGIFQKNDSGIKENTYSYLKD